MTELLSQFLSEPTEVCAAFGFLSVVVKSAKDIIVAKLSSTTGNSSNSANKKKRKKR